MKIKAMNDLKIKPKDGLIISIIAILTCVFTYFCTAGTFALVLLCFNAMELFTWVRVLGLWFIIIAFCVFFEKILT